MCNKGTESKLKHYGININCDNHNKGEKNANIYFQNILISENFFIYFYF